MFKARIAALGLALLLAVPLAAAPQIGQLAPAFNLPSSDGKNLQLKDFQGKWLVLYFYPADFTGGCTLQARRFQQDLPQYQKLNAQIVGVSVDSVDSHQKFCNSEGLKFPLLADTLGNIGAIYGAANGARNTYIVDPKGILRRVFNQVSPNNNSAEVLAALKELQS